MGSVERVYTKVAQRGSGESGGYGVKRRVGEMGEQEGRGDGVKRVGEMG